MSNLVSVCYADRFTNLSAIVKDESKSLHSAFWSMVKKDPVLDGVLFDFINSDGNYVEISAMALHSALMSFVVEHFPMIYHSVLDRHNSYVLNCEVAQASMLDPAQEQAQWALWEQQDAQQDAQDKIDMYRNEY